MVLSLYGKNKEKIYCQQLTKKCFSTMVFSSRYSRTVHLPINSSIPNEWSIDFNNFPPNAGLSLR